MKKNEKLITVLRSILAGIFISIGGYAFMSVGGLGGAMLFAFGLLSVICLSTPLYTGCAGFKFTKSKKIFTLPMILLFNVVGCLLMGLISHASANDLQAVANGIVSSRMSIGPLRCGILAIGCGIIMTTVIAAKMFKNTFLPVLFGVPAFIMCGFPHSVADAFYICACSKDFLFANFGQIALCWISVVIGNYIGCNIHNIFGYELTKEI